MLYDIRVAGVWNHLLKTLIQISHLVTYTVEPQITDTLINEHLQ
jgi:hypothetical protein